MRIPDISILVMPPFEVNGQWYEVFHGVVRKIFYGKIDVIRTIEYNWEENKDLVNEILYYKINK